MGIVTGVSDTRLYRLSQSGIERGPRLSAVLAHSEGRRFEAIVTLPSNVQAVETVWLFAKGQTPFVSLVGPSGWGKSHLIEATMETLASLDPSRQPQVVSAKDWLQLSTKIDSQRPLLIDNAQEGLSQHRTKLQMQLALERRVKAGRPTLLAFTGAKPTRAMRSLLPIHNSWVVTTIETPSVEERVEVVSQMARREGLIVSPSLAAILARHMNGSGRTLEGACKRLRLFESTWVEPDACLRALGLLNPYFSDNSDWDLRETIADAVESAYKDIGSDLAVYAMLRVALLAEADIAHFYEVEPSVVYAQATNFHRRVERDPVLLQQTRSLIASVVESLEIGNSAL